jgi:hypothetical protein
MKKQLLLLTLAIAILSINYSYAQKVKVTKDPFSGEKIVSAGNGTYYFESKGNNLKFDLGLTYGGQLTSVIPSGTELLIKLVNGDIIKLSTSAESKPSSQVYASQYSAGIVTFYVFNFIIDKATLNKFTAAKVELVRFPDTKGGNIDLDKKSRYVRKNLKGLDKTAQKMMMNI